MKKQMEINILDKDGDLVKVINTTEEIEISASVSVKYISTDSIRMRTALFHVNKWMIHDDDGRIISEWYEIDRGEDVIGETEHRNDVCDRLVVASTMKSGV